MHDRKKDSFKNEKIIDSIIIIIRILYTMLKIIKVNSVDLLIVIADPSLILTDFLTNCSSLLSSKTETSSLAKIMHSEKKPCTFQIS